LPTSTSDLWNAMLASVLRDEWIEIEAIYRAVQSQVALQPDDYEPSALGNTDPTWHRNVRNVLQKRKTSDILWERRGLYYFPSQIGNRTSLIAAERELRERWWQEILDAGGPKGLRPDLLRHIGIYGGQQGIWVDKQRTIHLSSSEQGATVAILHTGLHYPDDLAEDGVIYHYPNTCRPESRDINEIAATKISAELQLPVFVVTMSSRGSTFRDVYIGWVEGWDDSSRLFLVTFGSIAPSTLLTSPIDDIPFSLTEIRHQTIAQASTRHGQSRFRFQVMQRYGQECAVCGISVPELLEAFHIRPVSERGSDDARNGLILCANHHRAFDAGLFAINPAGYPIVTLDPALRASDLGLSTPDLSHLRLKPHGHAVLWHWNLASSSRGNS